MKLEDQVVSLELAKRLKELGVKQEGLFYWYQTIQMWEIKPACDDGGEFGYYPHPQTYVSAFTVAELGEMLPETLGEPPIQIDIEQFKYPFRGGEQYQIQVSDYIDGLPHLLFTSRSDKEADARAKMLIYLIEQKLIEVPK